MKSKLLIFALTLVSVEAIAQPVLTSASKPVAGDRFTLVYTAPFSIGTGVTLVGPDLIWDFSAITSTGTDTLVYDYCINSPHCSDFPGATITSHRTDSPNAYSYYNTDNPALSYTGMYDTIPIVYSNPEDLLRFPFTYNSTYRDTFSSTFSAGGELYRRAGNAEVTYVGYGTLTLPYGTFHDVLLIRTIEFWTDTIGTGVADYYSPGFAWYLPGSRVPLLSVDMLVRGGSTVGIEYYYTIQSLTGLQGLQASSHTVELFPNPTNDQCTIHADEGFEAGAYVDVVGVDGRLVAQHMLHGTDFIMPVSRFTPGLYICRIFNKGLQVKRLIVAR